MTSIKYMSKEHKNPYLYNSETKKSVWDESNDNDNWTRYRSTTYDGKYYWHNSKTNERIWETSKYNSKLKEKKPIIAKKSTSSYRNNDNDEYKEYDICNYNGISTTIRAMNEDDAMEQMRDIAQSLNPYD